MTIKTSRVRLFKVNIYTIAILSLGQLSRTSTQDNGILTISQSTSGDSGVYECVATDISGDEIAYGSARVSVGDYQAGPTAKMIPEK